MGNSRNEDLLENMLGDQNELKPPVSNNEKILLNILGETGVEIDPPRSPIEKLLLQWLEQGGGSTEPRPVIIKYQGEREFTLSKETITSSFNAIYYSYDKTNWTEWTGSDTLTSQNNVIYILCD